MLSTQAVAKDAIELNFKDLSISKFIKMVSKISKKNILISTPINGKINFISHHGISKKELFALLQSVLESKGFTLVEQNGFLTTVRLGDASKAAPKLTNSDIGQIHTQVIQVETADANTLSAQLRFLLSKLGKLVVSRDNNAFIVTDYPKNTKLIKQLIKQLDQKKKQDIVFMELEHVNVNTIFAEFTKIVNTLYNQKIVQQKVGLFKNDATNTLIMVAKTAQIKRLKGYLKYLDKPDKIKKQELEMVLLKNADAESVVKILTDIITKKVYPKNVSKPTVSADKALNALIFIASSEEIKEFKKLLIKIDRERQQVYVRAKVIEISKNAADQIGAEYGFGGAGTINNNLYTLTSQMTTAIPSTSVIEAASAASALSVNLNLLLTNGAAKSLSEPSILCINNKEASIYVGKTQSIQTSTSQAASTTSLAQSTFSREDIGLTLKVKPRIANDNKVTLAVEAKLEDILPGSSSTLPTTTKREVKTTAIVRDGETIIIGGLIRENKSVSVNKLPLLGDIPLIGLLFRSEKTLIDHVNLVVILTPYVISKSSDLTALRSRLSKLDAIEADFVKKSLSELKKKVRD